jgi:hypothetical protein
MVTREDKFVDFVNHLYNNYPKCFDFKTDVWTEKYNGEDGIFAVFIRTLVCNDKQSESVFKDLGKFDGPKKQLCMQDQADFNNWASDIIADVVIGPNQGDHRKGYRSKRHFPRTLREYLEMVRDSQVTWFNHFSSFDEAFNKLQKIHDAGPLFSFDLLERLYRSKNHFFKFNPEQFYYTGSGEYQGLQNIYVDNLSKKEIEKKGNRLMNKILEKSNIPKKIAYFEVESILCIYRKKKIRKAADEFLSCRLTAEQFTNEYAKSNCQSSIPRQVC